MARLKEKREKKLWKGIFQFPHTIYVEYAKAYSADQAKVMMLRRIAGKQGVSYGNAITYFEDHETYSVTEEE